MLGMSVAAEFVSYITGHTIGLCSLWHYIVMFLCTSARKVVPARECCHKKTHCNNSSGAVIETCLNSTCAKLVCYECAYQFSLKLNSAIEYYCEDHIEPSRMPDNWKQTL